MRTTRATIIAAFAIILIFSNTSFAQSPDFRKSTWGMSPAEVKNSETCKMTSEDGNRIIYECSLANIKGMMIYSFTMSNKLMRSKYHLQPDYYNMSFYIRDYIMLEDLLIKKYGPPKLVSKVGVNKENLTEEEWAAYLSRGEVRAVVKWVVGRSEILLTLSKIGAKPAIQVDYISTELQKLDIEEKSKMIIKDL